ncbi:MAG: hemolysin family protein [Clostridia bacterium]|nr:hemolysin family protein [Clostridia bacterium]
MDTDGNIRLLSRILAAGGEAPASHAAQTAPNVSGLILLFIIFVICGAYFGGSESGFSAMNKIRVKAKADDGDKRAKNAMYIVNNFDRALTTLLIGNNITHIAAASIATIIAARLFGTSDTVTVYCTIITTLIVFLFSEMIPKSFANDRSETTSLFSAGFLKFLMKVLYPLASFFSMISSLFTRILEHFVKHTEEPSITEDELYDIIDTIEEEGVMNEEQGDLFKSALDFSDTVAKDVMTMRDDICYVDASKTNAEILAQVRESKHTRLPVCDGDLDHVIGLLQIRTFIREYLRNPNVSLKKLLLPIFRVSRTAKIDDLLSEMRQHKFYLSIVADEDGKTLGIVTIEDFLEELVGEIWDEDDVVDKNFIKLGGNRFRVNTHMTIGEIFSRLGLAAPPARDADRPLLSILLEHFGRIPEEDDSFMFQHNLEITVEEAEGGHIDTVVLWLLSEEDLEERRLALEAEAEKEADES